MFCHEARHIIIIVIGLSWILSLFMLYKYSADSQQLQETRAQLDRQLKELSIRSEVASIEHVARFEKLGHQIGQRSARLLDEKQGTDDLTDLHSRKINLFVETNQHVSVERQFFKTFGSLGDKDLFNFVKKLPEDKRKRILVTGGAGFVGSHLVDSLMLEGHEVIVCDNFFTGRKSNVEHWRSHPNFELIDHDVINPLTIEVNEIYHLASPASPVHYMANPIKTIKTNTVGTINMLGLASRVGARIVLASTSEIYGDPELHPQAETYWGNTNPVGPRSCYDESKRLAESLAVAYNSRENVSVGIARIFNTYGPRMHPNDGRVVSNFVIQAIKNEPLTIYGSGNQTRSFQYITDLVSGLKSLMSSSVNSPVNLGNPDELSIQSLASQIQQMMPNSTSVLIHDKLPVDDPHRRRPDIRKAKSLLQWEPTIKLSIGLKRTIDYFRQELGIH